MTERTCVECGTIFLQKYAKRPMRFCGKTCRNKYHKKQPQKPFRRRHRNCKICGTVFLKTRRAARYCSKECYKKAWPINNRRKHNARIRQRKIDNPEWYALREPRYYRNHRAREILARPWKYMLQSRRIEAEAKGLPYNLTNEWASKRWTGRCEITGVSFEPNMKKGPWPFSASLDRINPKRGYTRNNSRFILWGCNALKGVGTDENMIEIAKAIVKACHTRSLRARRAQTANS